MISPVEAGSSQGLFGGSEGVMGKDDFLKILVTQLRHQDPMNPLKSEEFAAQLAQFSSVEQLSNISKTLDNSVQLDLLLNQAITNTMAPSLIGRQVKAVGNSVSLRNGDPAQLHYRLSSPAEKATIEIRDANGVVVRKVDVQGLAQGDQMYEWDGKDDKGEKVQDGSYTFSVTASDANGNNVPAESYIIGVIDSIRYEDGSVLLGIGGLKIDVANVLEIGMNPGEEGKG